LQEGPPLAPLKITAQIQSVFADKLKEQRDFVRAARDGKKQSDSLVRSCRARTEDAATFVAPPMGEIDEWESDFSVATKIVDYKDTMSAIAVALESMKSTEGARTSKKVDSNEASPDPFQEVTEIADFSDTGVAPSWGDTQNLIISSLDLPDTQHGGSDASDLDSAQATTRVGKQSAKVAASSLLSPSVLADRELKLPPLPKLQTKTQIASPKKRSKASREGGSSKALIVVLAFATVLVVGAIVYVAVRKSSRESAVVVLDAATRIAVEDAAVEDERLGELSSRDAGIGQDASEGAIAGGLDGGTRDAGAASEGRSSTQAGDETGSTETGVGTLRLSSSIGGRVYVNGKRRGRTPITISLPVGRHKIRVVPGAGKAKTVYVEIKEGQELRRRMRL